MPYPEVLIRPMRDELMRFGVEELMTAGDVRESFLLPGTNLVVVNSVCGCAARNARPAVGMALGHENRPDRTTTVFAGQDLEAVAEARHHFRGYPPSSPSMALLKDGEVVFMLPRDRIEGRSAEEVAKDLVEAFDRFCTAGE
ncbi:MAG: BrxA/BrxB family bacilliredoxin [Gemmatimonadota bacterium]|jgi:putative YphP/YqiW family bacilliredoxin|nr:BrxA/BrxB family bacilliredoxin [Gemmatimonadota bacterium]